MPSVNGAVACFGNCHFCSSKRRWWSISSSEMMTSNGSAWTCWCFIPDFHQLNSFKSQPCHKRLSSEMQQCWMKQQTEETRNFSRSSRDKACFTLTVFIQVFVETENCSSWFIRKTFSIFWHPGTWLTSAGLKTSAWQEQSRRKQRRWLVFL